MEFVIFMRARGTTATCPVIGAQDYSNSYQNVRLTTANLLGGGAARRLGGGEALGSGSGSILRRASAAAAAAAEAAASSSLHSEACEF